MSGPNIFRQITSLIEVTEDIMGAFGSIKDLPRLPEAFRETNKRLPLVEQFLQDAKNPAKKLKSTEDARALEIVLYGFYEKAKKLLEIVQKIGEDSKVEYDSSVYRGVILKQGKQRVETLMDGLLEDLATLAANRMFWGGKCRGRSRLWQKLARNWRGFHHHWPSPIWPSSLGLPTSTGLTVANTTCSVEVPRKSQRATILRPMGIRISVQCPPWSLYRPSRGYARRDSMFIEI